MFLHKQIRIFAEKNIFITMISRTYNRYFWLFNTLYHSDKGLTFKEIQNKWEKSYLYDNSELKLRTFHQHKDGIQEMFNVNIVCDAQYRYHIQNKESLEEDKARQWILNSFAVSNLVNIGQAMKDRILLEDIPKGSSHLPTVINAMKENKMLKIKYSSSFKDSDDTRSIEPYCMRVHEQRWYILAKEHGKDGLRQYALDRISYIEVTNDTFEMPADFSPKQYYKNSIGIWVNENDPVERVVIRAYGQSPMYLRSLPLHDTQRELESTAAYTDFEFTLAINNELVNDLLKHNKHIEVREPECLKKLLIETANSMLALYKK